MNIVFVSNFLNHHQVPVADELYKLTNGNYTFVETIPLPNSFRKSGYPTYEKPYYLKAWQSEDNMQKAQEIILNADVAFFLTTCLKDFAIDRLKLGKLSFEVSERWFKKGFINLMSPNLWKHQLTYYLYGRTAPLYMLCSSAFAAYDYNLMMSYKNRCYKWGYFTQVDEKFDIEKSIQDTSTSEITELMWCSRFLKWKHPELVIHMAANLKAKGYKFRVDIFGDEGNASKHDKVFSRKKLLKMITKYALKDYVVLKGNRPNQLILEEMRSHSIFLFTSDRNEGWGAVANEAMANGCVLVASDKIGSSPYLVNDGINGLLFKSGDINSLTQKVEWLLTHKEEIARIQRNAYMTMRNAWNPKNAAANLLQLINDLKNGKDTSIIDGPCSKDF